MKDNFKYSKPLSGDEWETAESYILENGEKISKKPENMTQLIGQILVRKDHPRIILRGKLDSFQSQLTLMIHQLKPSASSILIDQLRELLQYSMTILKHEVINTPIPTQTLLTWTEDEIKHRSHNPAQYFGIKQMILVDDTFNHIILSLNVLRASIREIEICAVTAFGEDRNDIILALNRMSSCFHILMYQEIHNSHR